MQLLEKRIDIIKMLPPGAVLAEIGCWRAYFGVEILNTCPVRCLYEVDPWSGQTGHYGADPKTVEQHEADLAEARHHLRGHLPGGRVKIVRGFSLDVAANNAEIPPLDAVYIDADHSYEAVLADLRAWEKRLKPTGFLSGHDYTKNAQATEWGFGVIEAVKDFCDQNGWQLTYLTREDFASFRLDRK